MSNCKVFSLYPAELWVSTVDCEALVVVGAKLEEVGEPAGSLNVWCGDWDCGSARCLVDDWPWAPDIVLEVEMECGDPRCIAVVRS